MINQLRRPPPLRPKHSSRTLESSMATGPQGEILSAAHLGDLPSLKRLALEGVDLGCRDDNGSTPMHNAALAGQNHIVEWLLTQGCDCNARTLYGFTPLMAAAYGGHLETIELLVHAGADLDARADNGQSCMDFADENQRDQALAFLRGFKGLTLTCQSKDCTGSDWP